MAGGSHAQSPPRWCRAHEAGYGDRRDRAGAVTGGERGASGSPQGPGSLAAESAAKAALGQQMALPAKATGTARARLPAPGTPGFAENTPKLFLDPNLLRN